MFNFFDILQFIVDNVIFIYVVAICATYIFLSVMSAIYLSKYIRKNSFIDYTSIISSPLAPSVSIIAPAYNESKTIIENVRALMSLYYPDFEVIIVNDGSTDNSLDLLIKEYNLEPVNYASNDHIETQFVRNIYKSRNKSFGNLIVIDKENGGKADSLNAGFKCSK